MGAELASQVFATACYVEWEQYPREALIAAQEQGRFGAAPIWGNGVVPLEAAYAIRTLLDAHGVRGVDLGASG